MPMVVHSTCFDKALCSYLFLLSSAGFSQAVLVCLVLRRFEKEGRNFTWLAEVFALFLVFGTGG